MSSKTPTSPASSPVDFFPTAISASVVSPTSSRKKLSTPPNNTSPIESPSNSFGKIQVNINGTYEIDDSTSSSSSNLSAASTSAYRTPSPSFQTGLSTSTGTVVSQLSSPKGSLHSSVSQRNVPQNRSGNGELYLTVIVEDYKELMTARSFTSYYTPSLTVQETLRRIAKKGKVSLSEDEISHYGLYYVDKEIADTPSRSSLGVDGIGYQQSNSSSNSSNSSSNSNSRNHKRSDSYSKQQKKDQSLSKDLFRLPSERQLKDLVKTGDTLLLKKFLPKNQITLTIFIEDYRELNCPMSVLHTFHIDATVEEVISTIARKGSVNLDEEKQECCALFLPTSRSKKGVFMERTKTLKSFHLSNYGIHSKGSGSSPSRNSTLIMKCRKKEEVLLTIEIENFKELNCARTVTSLFNVNITVEEVIQKIARKGNVFIENTRNYRLKLKTNEKLKRSATLKDYGVINRDILILSKNRLFMDSLWRKAHSNNVVILCERSNENPEKEILKFYSQEHEQLFWSLSMDSFEALSPETRSINIAQAKDSYPSSSSNVPILSAEQFNQNSSSSIKTSNNIESQSSNPMMESTKQELKESSEGNTDYLDSSFMKSSQSKEGKASRPGALTKKNIQANASLSLICIYHGENSFFSLAVNRFCTVQNVIQSLVEKLGSVGEISLFEMETQSNDTVTLQKLDNEEKILEIKENWQRSCNAGVANKRFYAKFGITLLRQSASSGSNENSYSGYFSLCNSSGDNNNNLENSNNSSSFSNGNDNSIDGTYKRDGHCSREDLISQEIPLALRYVDDLNQKRTSLENVGNESGSLRRRKRNSLPSATAIVIGGNQLRISSKPSSSEIISTSNSGDCNTANVHDDSASKKTLGSLVKWIEAKEVQKTKKISKGAFSKVFKGTYAGKEVAIKTLKGNLTEQQISSFETELEIMSTVRSRHLVRFYGAYVESDQLNMVMEYCSNGSLFEALGNKSVVFTWPRTLQWISQAVSGIGALHRFRPPLVHRDIKSLNLLLDYDWNLKVCDFGLSRFRTMTNVMTLANIRGTAVYCPPEIYDGQLYSVKSDIYSLGIVIWELVTRTLTGKYMLPFAEFEDLSFDFQIIVQTSKFGRRPTVPNDCPRVLKDLIIECWNQDPDKRPNCKAILRTVDVLAKECLKNPEKALEFLMQF